MLTAARLGHIDRCDKSLRELAFVFVPGRRTVLL
jgi:hypothetical protein